MNLEGSPPPQHTQEQISHSVNLVKRASSLETVPPLPPNNCDTSISIYPTVGSIEIQNSPPQAPQSHVIPATLPGLFVQPPLSPPPHQYHHQSSLRQSASETVKETSIMVRQIDPQTGSKVINRYRVIRELGRGVHGKVKLCMDLDTDELFAMKIVQKQFRKRFGSMSHQSPLTHIKKEIAILKKCKHPNIVQLIEVIDDPKAEKVYMIMEYVDGGEIMWREEDSEHGDASPLLPLDTVRIMFRDVVLGLEYLHFQGIVHRDIKPQNLLVSRTNQVKIADFGVSFFQEQHEQLHIRVDRNFQTSSGQASTHPDLLGNRPLMTAAAVNELARTAGSPAFFAPELCFDSRVVSTLGSLPPHSVKEPPSSQYQQMQFPTHPQTAITISPFFYIDSPELLPSHNLCSSNSPPLPPPMTIDRLPYQTLQDYGKSNSSCSLSAYPFRNSEQFDISHPSFANRHTLHFSLPSNSVDAQPLANVCDDSTTTTLDHLQDDAKRKSFRLKPVESTPPPSNQQQFSPNISISNQQPTSVNSSLSHPQSSLTNQQLQLNNTTSHVAPSPHTDTHQPPIKIAHDTAVAPLASPQIFYPRESVGQPRVGKEIDIWALGVTLYCLVFGCLPFVAATEFELFHIIPQQKLSFPITNLHGDLSLSNEGRHLLDLLERLLEKDPLKRISLAEVKRHPWLRPAIQGDLDAWIENTYPVSISVSEDDVRSAVTTGFLGRMLERMRRQFSAIIQLRQRRSEGDSIRPLERTHSLPILSIFPPRFTHSRQPQHNK